MPSVRINKNLNDEIYFITPTIKNWYYLFDRHDRWSILLDSLRYCQKHKNVEIFAWVFMLNHIHLLIRSPNVSGFICDFKKFTSKELKKNILATEPNVLKLFEENGKYNFWQRSNMPEFIESEKFFLQKQTYIENNPVSKNYVLDPANWIYSSANPNKLLELSYLD